MSTHRPRIDRDTAEQMLDGATAEPQAGGQPLNILLAAAAAPARPGELDGKQAAMAAFRAHLDPARQPRRPSMLKIALAKLLTVKAAAIAGAAAAGGVALAAGTGVIPNPLGAPETVPTPAHATGQPDNQQATPGANASPSPSLEGLCQAITAIPADTRGQALDNPAFRTLITAAGTKDDVNAFCDALPTAAPTGTPEAGPGALPSAKPETPTGGGAPSELPTSPPAGAPSDRPGAPTSPSPRR